MNKLKPCLRTMPIEDFNKYCMMKGLTNDEIKIATYIIRDEIKGESLYSTIGYSKAQTIRIRKRIFNKLKR